MNTVTGKLIIGSMKDLDLYAEEGDGSFREKAFLPPPEQ